MPIASDRLNKQYSYSNEIDWQERTTKLVMENLVNYRNQMSISPTHARTFDSDYERKLASHLRSTLIQHLQDGLTTYNGAPSNFSMNEDVAKQIATGYADRICLVGMGFDGKQQENRYEYIKQIWSEYDQSRGMSEQKSSINDVNPGNWSVYSYYMDTQDFNKRPGSIGPHSVNEYRLTHGHEVAYDDGYWSNQTYYSKSDLEEIEKKRQLAERKKNKGKIIEFDDEATDNRRLYGAQRSTTRERNGETVELDPATVALVRVTFTRNEKGNLVVDAVDIPFAASPDLKMNLETIIRSNLDAQTGVRMDKMDINQVLPPEQLSEKISQAELVDESYNEYMDEYDALIDTGDEKHFKNLVNKVAERTDYDAPDMRNRVTREIAEVFGKESYYHTYDKNHETAPEGKKSFIDKLKAKANGLTSTATAEELKQYKENARKAREAKEKDDMVY